MANADIEARVTDRRRVQGATSKPGTLGGATYGSVASMRTRLTAINPTTYNTATLNLMTKNDMEYAIRLADDAAGF